jgi:hypothetical protein
VGQDAKGRSYTAASIPGTGLYSREYSSQGKAAGGGAAPVPGVVPGTVSGSVSDAAAKRNSGVGLAVGILAEAFVAGWWSICSFRSHSPARDSARGGECTCRAAYVC